MAETSVHYRACNLCEAICGLEIRLEGGRIVSIRGDEQDPLSRGHVCPKAVALQDLESDPDRLRRPLRRGVDGAWHEVKWEAALDEIAARTRRIQAEHGRDAVGVYLGNPNVHNLGSILYVRPFLKALGSRSRFSASSVDQNPHHLAAMLMFGHQFLLPVADVDRTQYLLVLGANPLASNGSMMTAPGMRDRLKALRARGGKLVVVDPRRTETARVADRHLFIEPGTDALFLLALLHVLFEEGLARPGRLEAFTDGLQTLREVAAELPPERVAAATGIAAEDVRTVARELAAAEAGACYGRLGVSVQEFGGLCQWLVNAVNVVTGNLDRPGGAMFANPAIDMLALTGRGHWGRWKSRVRGLAEFASELPSSTLAEEIDVAGPGQVRALFTVAGNPVLSTPNGGRLEKALAGLELMVSIDPYLNETTRHAHFILPTTPPLQREHYDVVFHALAVRNTARWSAPLFAPEPGARHDWQVLAALARRLDRGPLLGRLRRRFEAALGPRWQVDLALRAGPHGAGFRPFGRGLTVRRLEKEPHGVDLGPHESCLPGRLRTRNGRIDLAPAPFVADLPRLREMLDAATAAAASESNGHGALRLIGRRQVQSNNSWMHNVPRLMRGKDRCTLLMHPADAESRGLGSGTVVEIVSRTGRVRAPLEVSDEMKPGVVSLPHGWGHHRTGTRMATAAASPGASLNDLTDELRVDALSGNAALSGVPVTVDAAAIS
ncbi:MAG TPA: molybdopterin-dependent oxidoreductase [Thermoanaerobaculia bacterium]|jgi:anaerobic selenocysteine-containing dehydrogenase|nr:molybdopterin-dependent oxidoreductase [Thermoanaerobaculia bacterium]